MDYAIIGDSHECVNELRRLIDRLEKNIPRVQIIHVSDYVDKGGNTAEMIRYMHFRHYTCGDVLLKANHENFVFGRLIGAIDALEDPVREKVLFGSQAVLLEDAELQRMFFGMWERSVPYFYPEDVKRMFDFTVTHAPCSKEHLGLDDTKSIKAQRNYRTIDRTIPTTEDLHWFYEQANEGEPLHIFGHMAHSGKTLTECQYKNKIFLDTGCVYGNGLSAVHICEGKVVEYYFEPSEGNRQPHATLPPPLGLR